MCSRTPRTISLSRAMDRCLVCEKITLQITHETNCRQLPAVPFRSRSSEESRRKVHNCGTIVRISLYLIRPQSPIEYSNCRRLSVGSLAIGWHEQTATGWDRSSQEQMASRLSFGIPPTLVKRSLFQCAPGRDWVLNNFVKSEKSPYNQANSPHK